MSVRVAVITGAARGIGLAVAQRLLQSKMMVVIADLHDAPQAARQLGAERCEGINTDISDEAAVQQLVATVVARHGRLDVLVNNAGISPKHSGRKSLVEDTALSEWQSVLDINLTGTFLMCRAALPHMRAARWGRIVNLSSQAGRSRSAVTGAHYAASKAGIIGFSRILAEEVGGDGITVNCVAPGRIATAMAATVPHAVNQEIISRIPLARMGTCEEVADAVHFLASDSSAYLTGVTLDVNGGYFMA